MCPNPRPRLAPFGINAIGKHGAILSVVFVMDVRLVPTGETAIVLHERMVWLRDLCSKNTATMTLKLPAHQRDDFVRVAEAIGGAVERREPSSLFDIAEQGRCRRWLNRVDVRVQQHHVVVRQTFPLQIGNPIRVIDLYTSFRQDGTNQQISFARTVVPVVTQKQHAQRLGRIRAQRREYDEQEQRQD